MKLHNSWASETNWKSPEVTECNPESALSLTVRLPSEPPLDNSCRMFHSLSEGTGETHISQGTAMSKPAWTSDIMHQSGLLAKADSSCSKQIATLKIFIPLHKPRFRIAPLHKKYCNATSLLPVSFLCLFCAVTRKHSLNLWASEARNQLLPCVLQNTGSSSPVGRAPALHPGAKAPRAG